MATRRPRPLRIARVVLRRLSRRLDRNTPESVKWLAPWATSLILHAGMLLVLGLGYYASRGDQADDSVHVEPLLAGQLKDDVDGPNKADEAGDPFTTIKTDEPLSITSMPDPTSDVTVVAELSPGMKIGEKLDLNPPGREAGAGEFAGEGSKGLTATGSGKGAATPGELTSPFAGRQAAVRAKIVRREGGSVESEKAVERGLDWLVRHQRPDGSWKLDHRGQCKGAGCPVDKVKESDTAATGLALLPLLGAGHIHTEKGRYQHAVAAAIKWLVGVQKADGELYLGGGGDTRMYSHAIATMALSEAYGISKDSDLYEPAQRAVNFIVRAQNPETGGWRYNPGEPGDTSVFGWQMFALRSASIAGLRVAPEAVRGCRRYLDIAATDGTKTVYSYLPGTRPSMVMTAEGLLCRQYLGWNRESPALRVGAQQVAADMIGGQGRNIYYWYYGTQLLHNMQGSAWHLWNLKVRDGLVSMQVISKGCDNGSWHPNLPVPDAWGKEAGRHYLTCLSLLTLEVYYRYLPIYRERDKNPVGGATTDNGEVAADAKKAEKKDKPKEPE